MKQNVQDVGFRLNQTVSLERSWYITGFVDGEGCFSVSFNKRSKFKTGIEIRPSFTLGQNKRNLSVLKDIQNYFGCGSIRFSKYDQLYKYEVRSIKDLRNRIVPHFKKYPLQTTKQNDFLIFEWVCQKIAAMEHLNNAKLQEIIEKAYTMNESGKRKYTKEQLLKILKRNEDIV